MNFSQLFGIVMSGLTANKLRSALTMLGIVIGVAAVIVLMAIGNGTTASVTSGISSLGSDLVFVRPGAVQAAGGVRQAQGSSATLTLQDAEALSAAGLPSVAAVAPESQTRSQVIAGNLNVNTTIRGVTAEYPLVRNYELADGDFFIKSNVDSRASVIVLGSNVALALFPEGDAVGKSVRVGNLTFKVLGTLVSKGGSGFGNDDDVALIPITTLLTKLAAQRTNQGGQSVSTINVKVIDSKHVTEAKDEIAAVLRERHKIAGDDDSR